MTNRNGGSPIWLCLAGIGSTGGALLHVIVVVSGRADWTAYFRAPAVIVQSMRDGTWLAPVTGLAIAALMQAAGLFAFSGAGLLPRLPFLRSALVTLAVIGVLRGLLLIALIIRRPALIAQLPAFDWVGSFIWALLGLCFAVGAWQVIGGKGSGTPPRAV